MKHAQLDWVLALLAIRPLDRVQLMKALFLVWRRSGNRWVPFRFVPYLYGPFSPDVYSAVEEGEARQLIKTATPAGRRSAYEITDAGRRRGQAVLEALSDATLVALVEQTVAEVASKTFHELLQDVYEEAPEFSTRSVLRARGG